MIQIKRSPFFMALLALITILSLFGSFLHHHDGADASHECPVCLFIQMVSAALLFMAVFFLLQPAKAQSFVLASNKAFKSLRLPVSLKDRAPPSFSSK